MSFRTILSLIAIATACVAVIQAQDSRRHTPVVAAVQRVAPAVVNIYTEKIVERAAPSPFGRWRDPFFDEFFRDFFEPRIQRFRTTSLGSGVIIRPDGYILTNSHVVELASQIKVKLLDEREFDADLVGADPDSDLAVLQLREASGVPYVQMGDSSDLMIGETVIAIGNPFGLSNTVTTGVVSALGRSLRTENQTYYDFIQTDASINPGNSGGPLLNLDGTLIGINAAIYQKAQGIGFAIPINRARRIVDDLISYGEVHIPWVGVFVQDITPAMATHFGVGPGRGVVVREVETGSPAASAGIEPGDVIVGLGGGRVRSAEEYEQRLRNQPEASRFSVELVRRGKTLHKEVRARPFPAERADALAWQVIGIRVASQRRAMRIVAVRPASPASRTGFQPGDLVLAIGGRPVESLDRFRRQIAHIRSARSVLLTVQRGPYVYHVNLPLAG